jgi:hypothetical protein
LSYTTYKAGELVYVPSGVVLERKQLKNNTPKGIKILDKPMDLLVTNVFDNKLEIYHEGNLWSVSTKDVF